MYIYIFATKQASYILNPTTLTGLHVGNDLKMKLGFFDQTIHLSSPVYAVFNKSIN